MELLDLAQFANNSAIVKVETPAPTNRASSGPPPLISKKWLCDRFRLRLPCGTINYKALYRKVLTPEVIAALGAAPEEIRSRNVKTFTRQQTIILIKVLDL